MTQGFTIDEEQSDEQRMPAARRGVRTRSQVMSGEARRSPSQVGLELLAHNPFNPREERTDIEETAESLRQKGQLQRLAVVTREAFLSAHPDQEAVLGEKAQYVVIDGNRRLEAARVAGLEMLRIDVNDALASSAGDLLEAALIANIHRVDVPALDQARAIKELLAVHGSQEKVAKRLGKSGAWVSQRLALLELPEDLQEKVESGELTVKDGRRIGRLPEQEQRTEAEKALNRVKGPRKPRGSVPREAGAGSLAQDGGDGGIPAPAAGEEGSKPGAESLNRVKGEGASSTYAEGSLNPVKGGGSPNDFPWGDAAAVHQVLMERMALPARRRLVTLLLDSDS